MTPHDLYEAQEAVIEARGGTSQRQRRAGWREYDRLRRLYPDTPCSGSA